MAGFSPLPSWAVSNTSLIQGLKQDLIQS
jgi:hypothetical protein